MSKIFYNVINVINMINMFHSVKLFNQPSDKLNVFKY